MKTIKYMCMAMCLTGIAVMLLGMGGMLYSVWVFNIGSVIFYQKFLVGLIVFILGAGTSFVALYNW